MCSLKNPEFLWSKWFFCHLLSDINRCIFSLTYIFLKLISSYILGLHFTHHVFFLVPLHHQISGSTWAQKLFIPVTSWHDYSAQTSPVIKLSWFFTFFYTSFLKTKYKIQGPDLICLLLSVATYQPPVLGPSGGAGGNALRPSVAPTAVTPPSSVPLHQLHALIGQTNTT